MHIQMILIAHPEKPLEVTAKGTVRRNICLAKYKDEIAALYKAVDDSSHVGPEAPTSWTPETAPVFVREVVEIVMGREVPVGVDLFSLGCDR